MIEKKILTVKDLKEFPVKKDQSMMNLCLEDYHFNVGFNAARKEIGEIIISRRSKDDKKT